MPPLVWWLVSSVQLLVVFVPPSCPVVLADSALSPVYNLPLDSSTQSGGHTHTHTHTHSEPGGHTHSAVTPSSFVASPLLYSVGFPSSPSPLQPLLS